MKTYGEAPFKEILKKWISERTKTKVALEIRCKLMCWDVEGAIFLNLFVVFLSLITSHKVQFSDRGSWL